MPLSVPVAETEVTSDDGFSIPPTSHPSAVIAATSFKLNSVLPSKSEFNELAKSYFRPFRSAKGESSPGKYVFDAKLLPPFITSPVKNDEL